MFTSIALVSYLILTFGIELIYLDIDFGFSFSMYIVETEFNFRSSTARIFSKDRMYSL